MSHLIRLLAVLFAVGALTVACASPSEPAPAEVVADANGFPLDWPIALPPGTITGCENGAVSRDDTVFSLVFCLDEEPDPLTASENYLATLERNGFIEREPGTFIAQQQAFLDGNGIEIFFQLIDNEATIVLIKPSG